MPAAANSLPRGVDAGTGMVFAGALAVGEIAAPPEGVCVMLAVVTTTSSSSEPKAAAVFNPGMELPLRVAVRALPLRAEDEPEADADNVAGADGAATCKLEGKDAT